jgi:2-iminobutanoate/2-iminopropanoate deaminase
MAKRQSIEIPGFSHANPIPVASRIGNMVMSSVISGRDPQTAEMPENIDAQIANIFDHVRSAIEAAGGTPDNILKMTFWVEDQAAGRAALNGPWEKMFPDAASRPARHTLKAPGGAPAKVTCDFIAVLDGG